MASLADDFKPTLEARGEYVVMANATTGWFAINPNTWRTRLEQAARDGRQGPNLIVYRTRSGNPRDHHAVPYALVRNLLTDGTLKQQVNGTQRWNLTLRDGKLHVTHGGNIDVHEYHAARLIHEMGAHVEDADFEQAVFASRKDKAGRMARLAAAPRQPARFTVEQTAFRRNPDVVTEVLERANGTCEHCRSPAPFTRASDGTPYLEVHHKIRLANDGEDTVENAVALCPNCHRRAHFA
jgi:5-methylcytosine-specific restriction endonuclease McrA